MRELGPADVLRSWHVKFDVRPLFVTELTRPSTHSVQKAALDALQQRRARGGTAHGSSSRPAVLLSAFEGVSRRGLLRLKPKVHKAFDECCWRAAKSRRQRLEVNDTN